MPNLNSVYLFFNGNWITEDEFKPTIFLSGVTIYEVIRVIDGIPLFNEDHLSRLELSAKLANFKCWLSMVEIKKIIFSLIKKNKTSEGNIQLQLNRQPNHRNISCRFIHAHYPSVNEYQHGVKTILFKAVRDNPKVKKSNHLLRNLANEAIQINEAYEALLIDKNKNISEGSRSNVFFVKDQTIYTSPSEKVLAGVTRQKIFDLCKTNNIGLIEKTTKVEELIFLMQHFLPGPHLKYSR